MIGQQSQVGECPPKEIVNDHDCSIFIVAHDVSVIACNLGLGSRGLAVPIEAGFAGVARHCESFRVRFSDLTGKAQMQ